MSGRRGPELPSENASYEELMAFVAAQRENPVNRATQKLNKFVSACVADPDFRDERSDTLLAFLVIVRDVLTDGFNEHWDMEDILAPILAQAVSNRNKIPAAAKAALIAKDRDAVIAEWLSLKRKRGERDRFADAIEHRFTVNNVKKYTADTVRTRWLSEKSIADYKARIAAKP